MFAVGYIFLRRNGSDDDIQAIRTGISRFCKLQVPVVVLLYPEGTLLDNSTHSKSIKFATKSGRFQPRRLLLPRAKGLHTILSCVDTSQFERVVNLTLAFGGIGSSQVPSDVLTVTSVLDHFPESHMNVELLPVEPFCVPLNKLESHLDSIWEEKDKDLCSFYDGCGRLGRDSQKPRILEGIPRRCYFTYFAFQGIWWSLAARLP